MKNTLLLIISIVMITNIANSQTKKEIKEEKKEKNYEAMKSLINSGVYLFEANLLTTIKGREFGLEPQSNAIVVESGKAAGSLQYFGEVNSIGANDDDGGVEFDGKLKNYKVKLNDKKKSMYISFSVEGISDNYNISMEIKEGGVAYVDIYSNNKSEITYSGKVGALK